MKLTKSIIAAITKWSAGIPVWWRVGRLAVALARWGLRTEQALIPLHIWTYVLCKKEVSAHFLYLNIKRTPTESVIAVFVIRILN